MFPAFGDRHAAELTERSAATVEAGFGAPKFDPLPGPWRTYVDADVLRRAVANVAVVREAFGSKVDVLIEAKWCVIGPTWRSHLEWPFKV